jgi:hypothetical protein
MGDWKNLLGLVRRRPDLVNAASEPKGYTPLHQAAWHGASLTVIGELLALGADPTLRTRLKTRVPERLHMISTRPAKIFNFCCMSGLVRLRN